VLGELLEQSFMTSMIKADGNPVMFFERPIAAVLGILTLLIWATMIWRGVRGRKATLAPSET
jgi:TctA family transporter